MDDKLRALGFGNAAIDSQLVTLFAGSANGGGEGAFDAVRLAGLTPPSVGPEAVFAGGAIAFALVAVGAVGLIAGIALSHAGSKAWLAGLAHCGVRDAADAVGIRAGKHSRRKQQQKDDCDAEDLHCDDYKAY